MRYGNGASAYRETRVMSSSPEQLVPMLYERLLVHLRRAEAQITARDFEGKGESLKKASEIVFELLSNLNFEAGGELASRLAALYAFFANEITEVGRTLDAERLGRVVEMVGSLHEAWSSIAATHQNGAAAGHTAGPIDVA